MQSFKMINVATWFLGCIITAGAGRDFVYNVFNVDNHIRNTNCQLVIITYKVTSCVIQ